MKAADLRTYYEESFQFLQARKKRQAQQLVLLSNMRRGDQNIASTLMLTLFNRILANVYDDKMQVKFIPSQGISQDQINAYNLLAQSDYQEMDKPKLDYEWCWDALFFGRGFVETVRFDKKRKLMQPHVINPLNFGYDPYFEDPQDWRYYWKWLTKSKQELNKLDKARTLKEGFDVKSLQSGIDPYLWDYKIKRDQARGGIEPPLQPYDSGVYQLLEFYGYNEDGEKCVYWIDKNFSQIIYENKLDLGDGEELILPDGETVEMDSKWPIVIKESFKVPHSSIPISVPDILEDKHRGKSVLLNLLFIAAKDQANPLYGYNPDKVRDVSQFFNRQINQHIPMDDEKSAWPLNKASTMSPELSSFITMLTQEAELPMGAGQPTNSPESRAKGTATQAALDQQLNDLAQSLISKVMQFGEDEFWSQWFQRYAKHAKELKEKTANIVGVKGVESTIISLEMFNADFPPGVLIYSAKEAEYKNTVKRRDWMQLYPNMAESMDADGFRNWNKYVFMPLMLEDPATIDVMYPKTIDEIKAEGENEQLAKDKMAQVAETDDHTSHLYVHRMLMPKTNAVWFHMAWHEELLAKQKAQQQAQGAQGGGGQQGNQGSKVSESIAFKDLPPDGQKQMAAQAGIELDTSDIQMTNQAQNQPSSTNTPQTKQKKINIGVEKKSPLAAASPLKAELRPKGKQLVK